MTRLTHRLAACGLASLAAGTAWAQDNVLKVGVSEYTTNSRTDGITGIGVPPGADAKTGDATTAVLTVEHLFWPNVGLELAMGIPPTIKADAAGSVAFLGKDVLSAKSVTPVLFLNYHFGEPGATWRPYLGAGANYTKFVGIQSTLAANVQLGTSVGWAAQGGVDYALNRQWGLFASVAALKVRSKLVASGTTVLQTTIDFRPVIYTLGVTYRF